MMKRNRQVFKTEDGEYLTVPDAEPATVEEICKYLRGRGRKL